jgi:hypothetical protein
MTTRDFDAMLAEKAGIRPTFKVGGQEFTLRSKLPYSKWNKLLAVMRDDDTDADEATEMFFNTVLVKGDRQRFLELLAKEDDDDDDDNVIGLQQMNDITDWVMEHFTGKHPSSSGGSSPGANGTGPQPNVISLSSKQAANA